MYRAASHHLQLCCLLATVSSDSIVCFAEGSCLICLLASPGIKCAQSIVESEESACPICENVITKRSAVPLSVAEAYTDTPCIFSNSAASKLFAWPSAGHKLNSLEQLP